MKVALPVGASAQGALRPMLFAIGILLVMGSVELIWKSSRIVAWQRRRLAGLRPWSPRWNLETIAMGGTWGPELQRVGLVATGIAGLLVGGAVLVAAIRAG